MHQPASFQSPWRTVLDTNVLISAYLFGGVPGRILQAAEEGRIVSLTSLSLKNELEGVLEEKFQWPESVIEATCSRFWQISEWIEPKIRLALCADEDDNRILECAIEGHAAFVVSGDRDLLRLPPFANFSILSPREFLDRLQFLV